MRNPLSALTERFRRRPEREPSAAPVRGLETMDAGAPGFQARLDEARERLRRDIPPRAPDDAE